jgi:putative flavoprotein involved in K+ transport
MSGVAIIGGGPAGLAAAATLEPLGLRVRVLDRGSAIGERWRGHYDRLRLHTTRRMSSLPRFEIPIEFGRWVSRDDFVRYLELYVERHRLTVELGTTVERVDRAGPDYCLTTSRGPINATFVIVAGGYNNVPFAPAWPGQDQFAGEISHSRQFRNCSGYRGKRVLVVGSGNSGAEIAMELADHGVDVWWSVRTPPTILPLTMFGVATQGVGVVLRPLPPSIVDPVIKAVGRFSVGDLSQFGLPPPTRGAYLRARQDRVLPILDVGLVASIKARRVQPVAAIRSFDARSVELVDGQRVAPDAVITCTGYRPALEPLVGHLGVLDTKGLPVVVGARDHPNAPGVHFIGYTDGVTGSLREINHDARELARLLSRAA